jgi:DNA-binding NtrC family response regulator
MNGSGACVLLVDDEERILRSLSLLLRPRYRVLATTDPQQALGWVASQPVHVAISDQRMPHMSGAALLREVKRSSPNTMRILLTGYAELEAVVESVNEGEIFRYVSKPWDAAQLRATVDQAAAIAASLWAAGDTAPAAQASGVLVIDEDARTRALVRASLPEPVPCYEARDFEEAFAWLEREDIGVIVSELMVGGHNGAATLKLLKARRAELVTVVLTTFRDFSVLVGLINQGQIFRLLPKPVRPGPLSMSLAAALRHHRLLRASAAQRARHAVEPVYLAPEAAGLSERLWGLLERLRGRSA